MQLQYFDIKTKLLYEEKYSYVYLMCYYIKYTKHYLITLSSIFNSILESICKFPIESF